MLIKKQDIKSLPLQELKDLDTEDINAWCESQQLAHFYTWTLPQMVAHFGTWTLARNSQGAIDCLETLKQNIVSDWDRGLWKLTRAKRGLLIDRQVAAPDYATFTPLVMMGFKRMQGIPYEAWRGSDRLGLIMEPALVEAVVLDDYSFCDLGSEVLLQIREQGLITKEGKTKGKVKAAESTWSLSGIKGTEIGGLPKLTQTMITQCWLAHPKYRTPYMILDPRDWDRMPQPLISTEIFQKPQQPLVPKRDRTTEADLPF